MRRLGGVNRGRDQGHGSRCIVARSIEQRTREKKNARKFSESRCLHRCTGAGEIPYSPKKSYGPGCSRSDRSFHKSLEI